MVENEQLDVVESEGDGWIRVSSSCPLISSMKHVACALLDTVC